MAGSVKRALNYTNRLRLRLSDVRLRTEPAVGGGVRMLLDNLKLPKHGGDIHGDLWLKSRIVVFAKQPKKDFLFSRAVCTVGEALSNGPDWVFQCDLSEFDDLMGIRFNLRVVAPGGRLLASLDEFRAENDRNLVAELLETMPADLGEESWFLDWSRGNGPVLLIDREIYEAGLFRNSPTFHAFVLPDVFRTIVNRAVVDFEAAIDGEESWTTKWVGFAKTHGGGMDVEAALADEARRTEIDEWIEKAIRQFSRKHSFKSRLIQSSQTDSYAERN
ncbi:hypothetical protein [Roseibium sp. RKSG952]|uniref:hypothetical protein n=1 Tax=Roseibium sp. RKSG952 TaxID=2529384 RepID=UPI0012BBDF8E|nr:hypothetical protein [Roseibium sp. RKSG952]MTH97597.1 hypothetical protein [Roseibium sp. RKSG952]